MDSIKSFAQFISEWKKEEITMQDEKELTICLEGARRNLLKIQKSGKKEAKEVPNNIETPEQIIKIARIIHAENPLLSLKQVAIESYTSKYSLESLKPLLEKMDFDSE